MGKQTATKAATGSKFEYVIFIRATPQQVWDALTKPEFTKQYWAGTRHETEWKQGASWKLMIPDGRVGDSGEIVEINEPNHLALKWRNEFVPELKAEGYSHATFDLEPDEDGTKLSVTHKMDRDDSKFIDAVSTGWPKILGSLKSLLETGESLPSTRQWPEGI